METRRINLTEKKAYESLDFHRMTTTSEVEEDATATTIYEGRSSEPDRIKAATAPCWTIRRTTIHEDSSGVSRYVTWAVDKNGNLLHDALWGERENLRYAFLV